MYEVLTPEPRPKAPKRNSYQNELDVHNRIIDEINAKRQEENERLVKEGKQPKKLERPRDLDHLTKKYRFSRTVD